MFKRFNRWAFPSTTYAPFFCSSPDRTNRFRDERFLLTIGNYQKPTLSLWSTDDYRKVCTWQDQSSTLSYLNCLAWNHRSSNEFCLGSSHGVLHFCTIQEESYIHLRVLRGQISLLHHAKGKRTADVTACVYLSTMMNLILCATSDGLITCWNTRLALCLQNWRIDSTEICWMRSSGHRLMTGSATGRLKLWNIEPLLQHLGEVKTQQMYVEKFFLSIDGFSPVFQE